MIRQIIHIDEEKCIGCGKCAAACHESAIAIIDGKARLIRDDYCDGLGNCLPECPAGAISFVEREAAQYDEAAVRENKARIAAAEAEAMESRLNNWPVQLKLVPPVSPVFNGVDLLIAADCTAYAFAGFHERFIAGHTVIIACPKLDAVDYSEKLHQIFKLNNIRSIMVTRMQVPCCGGLVRMVETALERSGKDIPLEVVIISNTGKILG